MLETGSESKINCCVLSINIINNSFRHLMYRDIGIDIRVPLNNYSIDIDTYIKSIGRDILIHELSMLEKCTLSPILLWIILSEINPSIVLLFS